MKNETQKEIIASIQKNMADAHIFNYHIKVNKTIKEVLSIIGETTPEQKKIVLNTLSDVLYKYLFDTYEEIMRDRSVWDRFFNNQINKPALMIDKFTKGNDGTKNEIIQHQTH